MISVRSHSNGLLTDWADCFHTNILWINGGFEQYLRTPQINIKKKYNTWSTLDVVVRGLNERRKTICAAEVNFLSSL